MKRKKNFWNRTACNQVPQDFILTHSDCNLQVKDVTPSRSQNPEERFQHIPLNRRNKVINNT